MSTGLDIDLAGLARAERALRRYSDLDFDDLLDAVGAVVESQTRRRITDQEGQPNGQPWEELSDTYKEWKGRESDGGILELYGRLRDSLTHDVGYFDVETGSNLVYAATHQHGDTRLAWGRVMVTYPARPYLGLSDENESEIEEAIEYWLTKEMGL